MRADIVEGASVEDKPILGFGSCRQKRDSVGVRQISRQFLNVGLPQPDDVMMPQWQLAIASAETGIGGALSEGEFVAIKRGLKDVKIDTLRSDSRDTRLARLAESVAGIRPAGSRGRRPVASSLRDEVCNGVGLDNADGASESGKRRRKYRRDDRQGG